MLYLLLLRCNQYRIAAVFDYFPSWILLVDTSGLALLSMVTYQYNFSHGIPSQRCHYIGIINTATIILVAVRHHDSSSDRYGPGSVHYIKIRLACQQCLLTYASKRSHDWLVRHCHSRRNSYDVHIFIPTHQGAPTSQILIFTYDIHLIHC